MLKKMAKREAVPPAPIMGPRDWEAEAVDFFTVQLDKATKKELLRYSKEAMTFISKTMAMMELRPKRSYIQNLKRI
jgi:hypothetical protein